MKTLLIFHLYLFYMVPENAADCKCPKTDCPRHGNCNMCVPYHRDQKGDLPFCLRPLAVKS
jgi:hypothetical protein